MNPGDPAGLFTRHPAAEDDVSVTLTFHKRKNTVTVSGTVTDPGLLLAVCVRGVEALKDATLQAARGSLIHTG